MKISHLIIGEFVWMLCLDAGFSLEIKKRAYIIRALQPFYGAPTSQVIIFIPIQVIIFIPISDYYAPYKWLFFPSEWSLWDEMCRRSKASYCKRIFTLYLLYRFYHLFIYMCGGVSHSSPVSMILCNTWKYPSYCVPTTGNAICASNLTRCCHKRAYQTKS